jgi:hypothetical protein
MLVQEQVKLMRGGVKGMETKQVDNKQQGKMEPHLEDMCHSKRRRAG